MNTLVEIQAAVAHLPSQERKALQLWLASQNEPEYAAAEEQRLLESLDNAIRAIDDEKGILLPEVRSRVASWAAK